MTNAPSWKWAAHPAHRDALQIVWDEAARDGEIVGLLVCGSVARGDALPDSDLDVRVLLAPDADPRPFDARTVGGVWVERTYRTEEAAFARLETRPMEMFPYREGRIVRDEAAALARLTVRARALWDAYQTPAGEKTENRHWLESTQRKIAAAQTAGDLDKAAYVAATSAWPILSGLFAAASCPLPPSGAVLANLPDAAIRLGLAHETVCDLWAAQSTTGRINAALAILAAVLPRLDDLTELPT